jgi:hypothetical protein
VSVSVCKFCPKRFIEWLVASSIRHDLPFRYVEQNGVRETMQCLHSVPLICENIAKANLIKMNLSEK